MVQRKRSQRKRSQRKRSLKKRSRKRSPKRIQSGGGIFSWFKTVTKDQCEQIAQDLLDKRSYTNPTDYVFDYNLMIANQSGILGKSGHKLKSFLSILGYLGFMAADVAMLRAMSVADSRPLDTKYDDFRLATHLTRKGDVAKIAKGTVDNLKNDRTAQVAVAAMTLTLLASIIYQERKKKKSQAKMILEVCANTWNNEYPNQKISTNDIQKMIKKNKHTRIVYNSIKNQSPSDMNHLIKHEQFMARQAPQSRSPQTININLNYKQGEAHKIPFIPKSSLIQ